MPQDDLTVQLDIIEVHEDLSSTLPLELDAGYNVTICSQCTTGLPFDWIQKHLKSKHGIRKQLDDVMEHLNIEAPTLSSTEIKVWISEIWALHEAFQGIPIKKGMACNECQYSSTTKKRMRTHFSANHPGIKWKEYTTKCKVQMPFKGQLKKYIQIEDTESEAIETKATNDWRKAFEQEFNETMAACTISTVNSNSDTRLLNAFVAKMRWDLCVKDMDLSQLQKLAASPVKSDKLHKVILCARKYIEKCCSALNGGNMMVKRHLMSAE